MAGWVGRIVGKVQIESMLARGGMGEVYVGRHTTLQRSVVVKMLRDQYEDDPDLLKRFEREAQVVAMLRHPNIVQVYDFDSIEGHPYIVMEYIAGMPLSAYLRSLQGLNQLMELSVVSKLLTSIASALQYAHERGVIHRDIKPSNILLTSTSNPIEAGKPLPEDVQPVLTDFGLVGFAQSSMQTTTGTVAGTPYYMSPEQALGKKADARSDIYSLGIVLYEMLTGHVPFDGDSSVAVLYKQVNEPLPPIQIQGMPPELQSVTKRALAKQPSDRFQTPNEFARAVQEAIDLQSESPTIPPGKMTLRRTSMTWLRLNWLPIAALIGVILVTVSYFAMNGRASPPSSSPTGSSNTSSTPVSTIPSTTHTAANPAAFSSPTPTATALPVRSLGTLHFQDGAALEDEAALTISNMLLPPEGKQYEAWLIDDTGGQPLKISVLQLDQAGNGKYNFVDPQARDLLAVYNRMDITVEPKPDLDPNPSTQIAYSASLPPGGLTHVRNLLVSSGDAPQTTALVDGLLKDATLIDSSAKQMVSAYQAGNEATVYRQAETILNVLVGTQSDDHRDWNKDGVITDPGDGFGILPNGTNAGYIQAAYSEADHAVTANDATDSIRQHGDLVKTCMNNLGQWAHPLHDLAIEILQSPSNATDMGDLVKKTAALADEMLKGTDLNGNQTVEPIAGECGMQTAYEEAYSMADMSIYPYVVKPSPTSSAGQGGPGGAPANPQATSPSQATLQPNPTSKPKPTSGSGGGSGGGKKCPHGKAKKGKC